MELREQIDSHFGLFVNCVAQVGDQELVLLFREARVEELESKEMRFNEGTKHEVSLTDIHPIITDASCKKYKATFRRFFLYEVVEESCICWDDNEVFQGNLFRTFSRSRFLNHISANLNVEWYKDAPEMDYQHYQVRGLDFIVNVASHEPPTVEEVEQFFLQ
jgi:hypothetical protein